MRILLNGESRELEGTTATLADLVRSLDRLPERLAAAVNEEVVPRERWDQVGLAEGDRVDLVRVMAGGSQQAEPTERAPHEAGPAEGDALVIAGVPLRSRLMAGTGKFSDPRAMRRALEASGAEVVTCSIRYMDLTGSGDDPLFLDQLELSRFRLLPNTAGARTARDAIHMAHLAREATGTSWLKLEVIGDPETLWPDPEGTLEAARILVSEGFAVLPYTSYDLVTALRLEEAGCATVMPMASMIGSGQGFIDWSSIRRIVERVKVPVIVDAGLRSPSDVAMAMELGADGVLVNSAIARASDPVGMASALRLAVDAGRLAYRAGLMPRRETAEPSSPARGVVRAS
ncbi:sulfur carrier protein ThiS [Limnochorda pilosa]|uniref:Thiazole synthase n=1 Tax=Limnochorda pilosa TaxID=1555112 RepID=A0A0K2SGC0_LIMPI|nr:sulfur carrier protein ThiS [Limnochorda pilosa]BAS26140.1 bifunctional sulfur carrier protein/thiazole synthase [Limnochorda pilosa]